MISNPILTGFHPDPSICRCGEDYYIATSTFEWFPGVRIFHSRDLQNWRLVSRPLDRVSQLDMKGVPDSGGIWAPCLTHADGLFWLVYTNVTVVDSPWKNGRNYLVTAKNIAGPWSEPVSLGNGGFDPSLFHHEDGRKFLLYRPWGPRHHSNPYNNIVMQEYYHQEQRLCLTRHLLFTGTERKFTEAPHLYKKGQYYYLVVAEGGTVYQHAVTVLRAKDLLGPYELHPEETIVCTWEHPDNALQKSGHACFVHTHSNEWYMVYLVGRPLPSKSASTSNVVNRHLPADEKNSMRGYCPLGRETAIDQIFWQDNWPYAVGGKQAKEQVQAPNISQQAITQSYSAALFIDGFDQDELDAQWQSLRIPLAENVAQLIPAATPENKLQQPVLRLYGHDSLVSKFTQATIAKRWQHFNFDAFTQFSFAPINEQQSAGLTCYYNSQNWSYCFVDYDEELAQRSIKLIQVDKNNASYYLYQTPVEVPDSVTDIWLKVSVREWHYAYSYSFDGTHWQSININFDAWKLSDDYVAGKGFFTGAFVGLHCEDISGDGCHADYKYFEYSAVLPC